MPSSRSSQVRPDWSQGWVEEREGTSRKFKRCLTRAVNKATHRPTVTSYDCRRNLSIDSARNVRVFRRIEEDVEARFLPFLSRRDVERQPLS